MESRRANTVHELGSGYEGKGASRWSTWRVVVDPRPRYTAGAPPHQRRAFFNAAHKKEQRRAPELHIAEKDPSPQREERPRKRPLGFFISA